MVNGSDPPNEQPDPRAVTGAQPGDAAAHDDVSAEDLEAGWQRWVLPFVEDSALGPVLIVIVFQLVALMAPLILFAVVERSIPAIVASLWLFYLSYKLLRADLAKHGSLGKISWLLMGTWLLSFAAAYVAKATGLF